MKEMLYAVRCLKSNEDMILAHEPNELTCSPLCDFIAQLFRALVAEVMGSNPVESPEFFRFMRQLLKLSSKCEDHIFNRFQTPHCI